jgi:hypothetical protein
VGRSHSRLPICCWGVALIWRAACRSPWRGCGSRGVRPARSLVAILAMSTVVRVRSNIVGRVIIGMNPHKPGSGRWRAAQVSVVISLSAWSPMVRPSWTYRRNSQPERGCSPPDGAVRPTPSARTASRSSGLRTPGLRPVVADDATVALRLLVDRRDVLGPGQDRDDRPAAQATARPRAGRSQEVLVRDTCPIPAQHRATA